MNRQFWIVVGSMAAGLILLGWLGWQFALGPLAKEKTAKEAELSAKQGELQQVKGAQAQYEKFKREAEATRYEVQLLRQRLDPELSEGELVRIINGQVRSLNPRDLTWEYVQRTASKVEGQSNLDEVLFKLKFKSDYETVGLLLNAMTNQLRLISPERVQLKVFQDLREARLTVDANLEFKMFLETKPKGGV